MVNERESLLLLGYILFATGRLDKAERVVAGLVRLFPDDAEADRLMAAIYARLGRQAEVLLITSRQALTRQSEPELAVMHWLRAEALWDLGRKDEAAESAGIFLKWRGRMQLTGGTQVESV